ncbi:MAG: hypothetical protein V4679_17505 [Pseudomonadota bacterium]
MKPIHYCSFAGGVLIPLALCFAGQSGAAGVVLVLTFVIEVVFSAITGKKGNDTEH